MNHYIARFGYLAKESREKKALKTWSKDIYESQEDKISLEFVEKVYVHYTKEVVHMAHLPDGSIYALVKEN